MDRNKELGGFPFFMLNIANGKQIPKMKFARE